MVTDTQLEERLADLEARLDEAESVGAHHGLQHRNEGSDPLPGFNQFKDTAGAPTHLASEGTRCWVGPDNEGYINNDGAIGWTRLETGGVGAPLGAQYVMLALNADLTAERNLVAGTGLTAVDSGANAAVTLNVDNDHAESHSLASHSSEAHSELTGQSSGDEHTQYALLAGRVTGQTLSGGNAASEALLLQGTTHPTTGYVQISDPLRLSQLRTTAGALNISIGATGPSLRDGTTIRIAISSSSPHVDVTGDLRLSGAIELDGALNHDGSTVGFFGTAPASQAAAYTASNSATDRAYDTNAVTLHELADIIGTLISDLRDYGLVQ